MTSNMGNLDPYTRPGSTPLPGAANQGSKNTIRVIDKPKGTPKSANPRSAAEDEDEDEGWAQMRQKREARKRRGTMQSRAPEPALYTNVE